MTVGDAVAGAAGAAGLRGRARVSGAFWVGLWPALLMTAVAAGLRFGYAPDAIQALAGTVAVPVLFDAVRRAAGSAAALAAAAALALMPESLLAAGSADAAVVLLLVCALWLGVRGLAAGPARDSPAQMLAAAGATGAAVAVLIAGAPRSSAGGSLAASGLLGLLRATRLHYDSVFGDVLVASAAVGAAALLSGRVGARRQPGGGQPARLRAGLAVVAAVWGGCGLAAFAASGWSDGRYLEAVAPALAIGLGLGTAALAGFGARGEPRRRPATAAIALALAAVCGYAFHFGHASTSWGSFALLESAVGAALLATSPGWPRVAGRWIVAVLVVACSLAAPVHETLALVRAGSGGTSAIAGVIPARSDPAAGANGGASVSLPVVSARVSDQAIGRMLPRGFLGFSFEYPAVLSYAGRDPAAINPVLLALVRALNPAGAPVLRIGGDSTDHTWWPTAGLSAPGGVNFALTPTWLAVTRSLAARLRAKLILGVNLAADDPTLAGAEARALVDGIGAHHIAALEVGNEADVYNRFPWYRASDGKVYFARPRSYDLAQFIADFDRWRSVMPPAPLAGPTFARPGWMAGLGTFLRAEPGLSLVTFHRYPTRGCESNSSDATFASIPNLMSPAASTGLAEQVAPFVDAAHADGLPFRLDELNSASCTGRAGVSNTFASSLWVLDTLFNLAAVGVDGINIHTLPGAAYEPFAFSDRGGRWSADVRPLYYGLLMFARAFPAGAQLVSARDSGGVTVWATRSPGGHLHVVLINANPREGFAVRLSLPGPATPLVSQALRAPSLGAVSGITLDGESFGSSTTTGRLGPNPHPNRVGAVLGGYVVTVPAASALLLSR